MFKKVLVLSASVGAGHVRAAQAVEKAFAELGAAQELRHVDALDYTNKAFRALYAKSYIVNPIPGQEERNADHLLEQGAAIRCNNLPVLAYKIDQLLDDPARFAAMRARVRQMAQPRAAYEVVATLLRLREAKHI